MSLRILIYVECNRCRATFEQRLVSAQSLNSDLPDEVHGLVLAAEDDGWSCRRNATEHFCAMCMEPF
jgi:hypothetical protein